jgi:hypothetical protein
VVPYGSFSELLPFLKSLLPKGRVRSAPAPSSARPRAGRAAPLPPMVRAYQQRLAEETRSLRLIGFGENLQIDKPPD